jgi:hypothetical protein
MDSCPLHGDYVNKIDGRLHCKASGCGWVGVTSKRAAHDFVNIIRILQNTTGFQFPKLSEEDQYKFTQDQYWFLMKANDETLYDIWQYIEKYRANKETP